MVYGQGGLKIGNGVRIATQSTILPSNHIFDRKDIMIYEQVYLKKGLLLRMMYGLELGLKFLMGLL